jgi:HAD superfamily hydrolase (TIGR01457 family)
MNLNHNIKAFMLDLDGTLYVGPDLVESTGAFLKFLKKNEIPHLFVTNNSSQSAIEYKEKLIKKGLEVDEKQVITSGDSSIIYLQNHTDFKRVFLIGTPSLENDFKKAGFILDEDDPQCVVLGFDTGITYKKLELAGRFLYAGLPYYATQPDITCITERGLTPDVGVFIEGLKLMTGRDPLILGKPSIFMVEAAMDRMGLKDLSKVCMVGDQLDTDITMGVKNGLISVLVLSGETNLKKAKKFELKPDYILKDVGELLNIIK